MVLGDQAPLVLLLGERKEHERRAQKDGDDARKVGEVGSLQERGLGPRDGWR